MYINSRAILFVLVISQWNNRIVGVLEVTIKQDAAGKPLFIAHSADVNVLKSREVSREDLVVVQLPKEASTDTADDVEREQARYTTSTGFMSTVGFLLCIRCK